MRYLYLILIMVVLSGCMSDDWRAAIAQERVLVAENVRTAQNAQISQAQSADSDRRNAQAMLQALQAQQAIAAGQAAIAQADAQTAIVMSNNEALVLVADRIAQASQTDYTPLYVGLAALVVIVIALYGPRPCNAMKLLFRSKHAEAWLLPDGNIHLRRLTDGRSKIVTPKDSMYQWLLTGDN